MLPEAERPRERLLRLGAEALPDAELLALVLGSGTRGCDAVQTARVLLARFGDLRRLSVAGIAELAAQPAVGFAQACRIKAALALATRLGERPFDRGESISGPRDIHERIGRRLVPLEREVFLAVSLDAKHRVLAEHRVADGGVCSVQVLPRDLFACIVREAAAAVIFVHNHPSGDPRPSPADEALTQRLTAAGALVGVAVLDHVIVGVGGYYAFSEKSFFGQAAPSR